MLFTFPVYKFAFLFLSPCVSHSSSPTSQKIWKSRKQHTVHLIRIHANVVQLKNLIIFWIRHNFFYSWSDELHMHSTDEEVDLAQTTRKLQTTATILASLTSVSLSNSALTLTDRDWKMLGSFEISQSCDGFITVRFVCDLILTRHHAHMTAVTPTS